MKRLLFSWFISKTIIDSIEQQNEIDNYEPVDVQPEKQDMIIYEYWPAFDNDIPSLELAYQLYEENNVCHILKNGTCKCYLEFMGGDDYITTKQENFFERI